MEFNPLNDSFDPHNQNLTHLSIKESELNKDAPEYIPESKFRPLDIDNLYETNLKIFGDVFESLVGAVFMDSMSIEVTKNFLLKLIKPYIRVYADLDTL